jgi:hypothetical protein
MKGQAVPVCELQRGAEGVADGEAKEGAAGAVADGGIEVRRDRQECRSFSVMKWAGARRQGAGDLPRMEKRNARSEKRSCGTVSR